MSLAITNTLIAHEDARAEDVMQNFQDIETWANNLYSGSHLVTMLAPAWTEVLSLAGVGTTADTDLDLTANTAANATHAILKVALTNSNTTEGSFIALRAKGAAANETARLLLRANQVSNFHMDYPCVIVPLDSQQRMTYSINSNAAAMTVSIFVIGYLRALPL